MVVSGGREFVIVGLVHEYLYGVSGVCMVCRVFVRCVGCLYCVQGVCMMDRVCFGV